MPQLRDQTIVYTADNYADMSGCCVCMNLGRPLMLYLKAHGEVDMMVVLEDAEVSLKRGHALLRALAMEYSALAVEHEGETGPACLPHVHPNRYARWLMPSAAKSIHCKADLEFRFMHVVLALGALDDRICNLAQTLNICSSGKISNAAANLR